MSNRQRVELFKKVMLISFMTDIHQDPKHDSNPHDFFWVKGYSDVHKKCEYLLSREGGMNQELFED